MSWEPAAPRRDPQRWVAAAVAALLVAGALVAVGRVDVGSGAPPDTDQTSTPVHDLGPAASPGPVDPASFARRPLAAVDTVAGHRDGPVLPNAADRTLLVLEPVGLRLVDLRTGDDRLLRLADSGLGSPSGDVIAAGRGAIVGVGGDVVWVGDGSRPVRMAMDHRLVSAGDRRSVWLHTPIDSPPGGTATLLRHDGDILARIAVPRGTRPIAGTAAQLVVGGPGTVAVLGVDGSRRMLARGHPVASDGRRVAWVDCADDRACAVVIGTVDDPGRVRTTLPPGGLQVVGLPAGAFSPDGRWLALPLPSAAPGEASWSVTVLDTATGVEVRRLRGSSEASRIPLAWSPDARWLVADTPDGMVVWQPGTDDDLPLDGPRSRVLGLAVR